MIVAFNPPGNGLRAIVIQLWFILTLSCTIGAFSQHKVMANDTLLTVDQTYGAVFFSDDTLNMDRIYSRANPDSLDGLIAIASHLDDPESLSNAFRLLGHIAGSDQVEIMINLLSNRLDKSIAADNTNVVYSLKSAFERMARRGSRKASAALLSMTKFDFWKERFDTVDGNEFDDREKQVITFRVEALNALARSGYTEWKEVASGLRQEFSRLPDNDRFKTKRWCMNFLDEEAIEHQLRSLSTKVDHLDPLPAAMLEKLSQRFNGDFEHPGPFLRQSSQVAEAARKPPMSLSGEFASIEIKAKPEDTASLKAAILSAQAAFKQYSFTLKNGEYIPLARCVLNKETLQPLKESEQRIDDVIHAFDDSRSVLDALGTNFKATRFNIVTHISQADPKLPNEGAVPFIDQRSITVKWVVPESAAEIQRLAPEIPRNATTLTKDGDMIIYMKWINGKWYWLPLGW